MMIDRCPPQKIECHDFGQSLKRFVACGAVVTVNARGTGCILEATGLSLADLHRLQREIATVRQRLLKSGK
jgi:hypothetical protein